jgi:hypothetical protein
MSYEGLGFAMNKTARVKLLRRKQADAQGEEEGTSLAIIIALYDIRLMQEDNWIFKDK